MKSSFKKLLTVLVVGIMSVSSLCACDVQISTVDKSNSTTEFSNSLTSKSSSNSTTSSVSTPKTSSVSSSTSVSKSSSTSTSVSKSNSVSTSTSTSTTNSSASTSATNSQQTSNSSTQPSSGKIAIPTTGVQFAVDASFSGTDGQSVSGVKTYKTITACLKEISQGSYSANQNKIVNIAKGTYEEKLTIPATMQNVVFVGDASKQTIITYGDYASLYTEGTDATGTISVLGEKFSAFNIVFENSFPYLTSSAPRKQALALFAKADKLTFENCEFWGYQDTVETVSGRVLFNNCLIAGLTDFIFGNNPATLFNNCEIKSRDSGKSNGGYIVASKGNNGTNDQGVPKFSFVFLNCKLTADSGVDLGSVALARPWRKNGTVAYIHCEMGAQISKKPYTDGSSKQRYVFMNGGGLKNEPQNANFVEYGNTGAGSITSAVNGCKMLSKAQADEYTYSNIFACTNGSVTYSGEWNPLA